MANKSGWRKGVGEGRRKKEDSGKEEGPGRPLLPHPVRACLRGPSAIILPGFGEEDFLL